MILRSERMKQDRAQVRYGPYSENWGLEMNRHSPLFDLLFFLFLFSLFTVGWGQDVSTHPATNVDAEPGLTLASADRVFLHAELGATMQPGLGRYSSHPSGRGAPSADRALEGLEKAIAKWGRFTVVNEPEEADLVLVIVEGNRTSGIREGVLTEKLAVFPGGSVTTDAPVLWQSQSHDGGVRDYRPVSKTVDEFRSAIEEYAKKIPKEVLAQARANRKVTPPSRGCAAAETDPFDCLAHGDSRLFLPEDRAENQGTVRLSEVVIHVSMIDLAKKVSSKDLSDYVVAMQKLLHQQFSGAEQQAGKDMAVVATLQTDGKAEFRLASRPLLDQEQMQKFYDALLSLPRPKVSDSPVEFKAVFMLWGGSEDSKTGH
jgi:hypothetical protein